MARPPIPCISDMLQFLLKASDGWVGIPAGQVVMEGFLRIRMPPWLRRLSTRLVAVVPAAVVAGVLKSPGNSPVLCLLEPSVGCYMRRDAFNSAAVRAGGMCKVSGYNVVVDLQV